MRRLVVVSLLICGCVTEPHEPPYCIVAWGDPNAAGQRMVMCSCESGAPIPPECGGGVAPVESR